MRNIINISLPQKMAEEVRTEVSESGFASISEYFRHLLREERERRLLRQLSAQRRGFAKGKGKVLRSLRHLR